MIKKVVKISPCFICSTEVSAYQPLASEFRYRGAVHAICGGCRGRFWKALDQAAYFGNRFRFLVKDEMPRAADMSRVLSFSSDVATHSNFRKVFSILTLLKERQEIRQKEVNWMVTDLTKKILKLPDQIATIVAKTFAVRGDDATLSDDQALVRIRDLLESIDEKIIDRNKNKRLP